MSGESRTVLLDRPVFTPVISKGMVLPAFDSREIECPEGFLRAAPSWNVRARSGEGFAILIRAGTDASWSRHLRVGGWGDEPPTGATAVDEAVGAVEVDEFSSTAGPLTRLQFRILFSKRAQAAGCVARLAAALDVPHHDRVEGSPVDLVPDIPVPARSQFADTGELGARLCSPTCVAMVLHYFGVHVPTLELARVCYDARHDIFGNWTRAIETAFHFGVPGCLLRFASWADTVPFLARGLPIIASIRFADGALPGAPLERTDGHLAVVTGLDGKGGVLVRDPAFRNPASVATVYPREPFGRAWFHGSGIGYVLGE